MKLYYFIPVLLLLTACTEKGYNEEKIYSIKEYKDLCISPNLFKVNAQVIEKQKCTCPDDPSIICDCFGGGTLSLGDEKGIIEYFDYFSIEPIWNNLKEGEVYLFTIKTFLSTSNKIILSTEPSNNKYQNYREFTQELIKKKELCNNYKIKGKITEKKACFPPAVEGIVYKCEEDIIEIKDGNELINFTKINKDVLKRIEINQKYIFTIKDNEIINAS